MKKFMLLLSGLALGWTGLVAMAQEPFPPNPPPAAQPPRQNPEPPRGVAEIRNFDAPRSGPGAEGGVIMSYGFSPGQGPQRGRLHEALEKYRNASDESKSAARGEVREELAKEYDRFLEEQQRQIEQLKERIAKLEQQLERRREAKDRMVDLRLEMVLSEADGLGWPGMNPGEPARWLFAPEPGFDAEGGGIRRIQVSSPRPQEGPRPERGPSPTDGPRPERGPNPPDGPRPERGPSPPDGPPRNPR